MHSLCHELLDLNLIFQICNPFFLIKLFKQIVIQGNSSRRGHHKHLRSDHTQTSNNTTILYYHEAKKSSFEGTFPNHVEGENVHNQSLDETEDHR